MSNAEKVAEHAAGGCVGALALMLGDPTGGTVAVAGSLAGLALLARTTWGRERDAVAARAALSARAAVADCRDYATADLGRVAVLLSEAQIDPLTPEDLIAVVQGSETYRLAAPLAGVLRARIRFDGDSAANIALVRVALESAMSACCADSTFKNDLQTLLMMTSVRQNDAVLATLTEMRGSREAAERELGRREGLLIGLVRPIAQGVDDFDTAIRELERAVGIAADLERQAMMPSNLGDQVNAVLRRMQEQNRAGDLDGAAQTVDDALGELEAEKARLLDAAVEQQILRRDAGAAATRLWQRRQLDLPEGADRFEALRGLQDEWYVRGRDKGLNFDLEVAIRLAGISRNGAQTSDQRGAALNDLGNALLAMGRRETGTDRLEEAVTAYHDALRERTRARVPLDWAMTQNNLGNALRTLGARETGTDRLEEAVAAYRDALREWTRARVPLDWAATQNNLGNALATLGEREPGTDRLEEAVTAYGEALRERTRERVPLDWAMTQSNLALLEVAFFDKTGEASRLEAAEGSCRAALEVFEAAGASHYVGMVREAQAAIAERRGRPGQVSDRDGVGA
ncbi:tetratricopeptide repeat protein [Paracoccus salsus]|uniref:tetratricopeptide repeat protein n=1 Tax=Paracoccus salsus TaxID=2911061 RepID=UPI001F3E7C5A|nr:tetratricopeptide repeat protein [Paracoccus salsus]MCF3972760.1 tetratricopeptide repeat protein [Paracoccus salsus]